MAAPAIVRAGSLMPIRGQVMSVTEAVNYGLWEAGRRSWQEEWIHAKYAGRGWIITTQGISRGYSSFKSLIP